MEDVFGQSGYDCRLQWGFEGVRRAAREGHVIIIVDTLVFSTSTTTIVAQGGQVLPVGSVGEAREAAARWGAVELAGRERLKPVTVVACGERWENDTLRPSLEDELGAGAILAALSGSKSPEARAAETLYQAVGDGLAHLVWESGSGRELRARGYEGDVTFATRVDAFDTVAIATDEGWLVPLRPLPYASPRSR